jgi:hypothetical protein
LQGAFLNGKRLTVSNAQDVHHAMIVNNIGKGRDAPFITKTLNRLDALLTNNVQVRRSQLQRWLLRGCICVNLPWNVCRHFVRQAPVL